VSDNDIDNTEQKLPSDVSTITIEDEMQQSYLAYAMSVIISRALPDVRDGLKPVHRRIIFAMKESGYDSTKPYRKSARIVGDVMGKYHPHGDSAIYDAMVRMAQEFSMRLPLIDGQGNFGSMDGDGAAAMRYTEARLEKVSEFLIEDIDKDTVDFQPNYDESLEEPTVLPARFPNILVNGGSGIAVGMSTNIPPHNLGEVIDAALAHIQNPDISIEELLDIIPGPDFPTGAIIMGVNGCRSAMHTGKGSVVMRARHIIEEIRKDRQALVFTEIPYQVNKELLVKRIAECVNEKIIEGISELRDESDRDGVRVVVELKRDAIPDVVLNQLFVHTPLQTNFPVNLLALNKGRPEQMNLKTVLQAFIEFREKVITRRTEFELRQAREKAQILLGLAIAVANIDEMIELIKRSGDPAIAKAALMDRDWNVGDVGALIALVDESFDANASRTYRLNEVQAKAILDLKLHRLTGLERDKIGDDLKNIVAKIEEYLDILGNRDRVFAIMSDELTAVKVKFATPRRTAIEPLEFEADIEDLIAREDMVVTVSSEGYVKRVPISDYRAQRRGGKGRTGMITKEEDFVRTIFVASTHDPILFFSSLGRVYKLKVYKLPLGKPTSKGKALVNLLPLSQGETITTVLNLPEDETLWDKLFAVFATSKGFVRRNLLSDFCNVRASGIIAMKLDEGDELVNVNTCSDDDDILLATKFGKAIRFSVDDVRVFAGRNSVGVRGIKLAADDVVIHMSVLRHIEASPEERAAYLKQRRAMLGMEEPETEDETSAEEKAENGTSIVLSKERYAELEAREEFLLIVSERGFGKRTSSYEYRISGRGGQGIWNMDMSERNGSIVAAFPVKDTEDIILVSDGGQIIRLPVRDIRVAGRRTQGVIIFRIDKSEKVVSVASLEEAAEDDTNEEA